MASHKWFLMCLLYVAVVINMGYTQLSDELHREADPFGMPAETVKMIAPEDIPKSRPKRGVFWDFFQKMVTTKNLLVDQYVDTRDTLSEVYNLLNDGFSDPAPRKATIRPQTSTAKTSDEDQSDSAEMSTTTEAFRVSRYELGRILGRNFRGLQRLAKIEFQDAFNQSHYNIQEYKEEAHKQFANSVGVEKVNKIKGLKAAIAG